MTQGQKLKVFQSGLPGKGISAIDQVNEFISNSAIKAISISVDGVFIYLLYEELSDM